MGRWCPWRSEACRQGWRSPGGSAFGRRPLSRERPPANGTKEHEKTQRGPTVLGSPGPGWRQATGGRAGHQAVAGLRAGASCGGASSRADRQQGRRPCRGTGIRAAQAGLRGHRLRLSWPPASPVGSARWAISNVTMSPRWSRARTRNRSVILVGAPMGAVGVLSYAATANDLTGVVTVSSPGEWRLPLRIRSMITASLARTRTGREFARRRMGVRIAPWTSPESLRPLVERVTVPVAVVHGRSDAIIPHGSGLARAEFSRVRSGPLRSCTPWATPSIPLDTGRSPPRSRGRCARTNPSSRSSRRRRMPRHAPSSSDRARELAGREHRPQGAPTTGAEAGWRG